MIAIIILVLILAGWLLKRLVDKTIDKAFTDAERNEDGD